MTWLNEVFVCYLSGSLDRWVLWQGQWHLYNTCTQKCMEKKRKPANAASWGFRPVMWCILILLIWRLLQVAYTNFVRVLCAGWTHNLILCFVPDCWHTSRARAPCVGPGVRGLLIRHRMFWNKGWYMDYSSLPCIYSYDSRTSWSTRKLPDPLGVEL